ncbi:MAG: DUF881 domain-containing protein [Marinisporobacter sp.]|jgi:uncharacterized protein YlxW (UPF0749 family)|nr:DUF881 domain-containing protein [Marinisporobacter sp.]
MLSICKQNSRRFIILAGVFLLIAISLSITGCTQETETMSSEQNMENIQILTGEVDVEGEGVSITLTETLSPEQKKQEVWTGDMPKRIIHDIYLIETVNLLRNAGAEVISINDERLISTSKIQAYGPIIKINNSEYGTDCHTIKAIGNAEALSNALNEEDSCVQLLKKFLAVKIERKDQLFIPKYKERIHFKYAKPVKKEK